jgi:chromosome segregation ATPase
MKMTKAVLEAEHAKLIEAFNNQSNELVQQDQTITSLKSELAQAIEQRNLTLNEVAALLKEAEAIRVECSTLRGQTERLAADTLAYRSKGLIARLLWALKGGAP